jgi:hypothetical protein
MCETHTIIVIGIPPAAQTIIKMELCALTSSRAARSWANQKAYLSRLPSDDRIAVLRVLSLIADWSSQFARDVGGVRKSHVRAMSLLRR